MARDMLLAPNLPKYLWTYAVKSATYVPNCCCYQHINNTPYGSITKLKPNIARLHIFGSDCYSYIQNSKKLDACSRKGHFVGYDKESPLYLAYYPKNNTIMKHRVIKFTNKNQMSSVPIDESSLFTDNNEIGTPSVKSEDKNTPEIVEYMSIPFEYTRQYPLRKANPPPYLSDYVTKSESEDLVNHVNFCSFKCSKII